MRADGHQVKPEEMVASTLCRPGSSFAAQVSVGCWLLANLAVGYWPLAVK